MNWDAAELGLSASYTFLETRGLYDVWYNERDVRLYYDGPNGYHAFPLKERTHMPHVPDRAKTIARAVRRACRVRATSLETERRTAQANAAGMLPRFSRECAGLPETMTDGTPHNWRFVTTAERDGTLFDVWVRDHVSPALRFVREPGRVSVHRIRDLLNSSNAAFYNSEYPVDEARALLPELFTAVAT